MVSRRPTEVTRLLEEVRSGDAGASDRLFRLVYDNLRDLASAVFAADRRHHTLQPTALVHEAWLKMAGSVEKLQDRKHFFAVAARAMRQVLADHAKAQGRQKRGGGRPSVTLSEATAMMPSPEIDLVELHDALDELGRLNDRHALIVELRMLGGLTIAETAELLDLSATTVKDDWSMARAWLLNQLSAG